MRALRPVNVGLWQRTCLDPASLVQWAVQDREECLRQYPNGLEPAHQNGGGRRVDTRRLPDGRYLADTPRGLCPCAQDIGHGRRSSAADRSAYAPAAEHAE